MSKTDTAASPLEQALCIFRLALGPALLMVIAATQSVRVTGVVTVSLAHPPPHWRLAIADVLAALVLGAFAFWVASALAGRRVLLSQFFFVVASAQLPLAAVALLVGQHLLAGSIVGAVGNRDEDELVRAPLSVLSHLTPNLIGVLLVTILLVGVLYLAYRRATRLDGLRLLASFMGGVIIAELLCRLWSCWAT